MTITEIAIDAAKAKVVKKRGGQDNQFVEPMRKITAEKGMEIALDEGENMKAVKTQVTQASKLVGVRVVYGETAEGTLMVTLAAEHERAAGEKPTRRGEDGAE